MSEKQFDSSLPHLEQAGWQPGTHWVPTIEQQGELELRTEAESIADRIYELQQLLGAQALDSLSPLSYPPQDPEEREKSIQENIIFAKQERDYNNRPFDQILTETLRWIDQFDSDSPTRIMAKQAMEREATALLRRKAEYPEESTIDPEVVKMSIQWAAIEHFMYHWPRSWAAGISYDDSFKLIADAGISEDELYKLLDTPLNPKAGKKGGNQVAYENQALIEKKLIDWATMNNIDISSVHASAALRHQLGI